MLGDGQIRTGIVYRFDQFELDPARGTLRKSSGDLVEMRPKAYALLMHLVLNPGQLHARQALMDTLWPDVAVTDASLTQCVSELRRALESRAGHVLRTVSRRGYRLDADVEQLTARPSITETSSPGSPMVALPREQPDHEALWATRAAGITLRPIAHPANDLASSYLARTLASDLVSEMSAFEDLRVHPDGDGASSNLYRVSGEIRPAGNVLRIMIGLYTLAGAALFAVRLELPMVDLPELAPSEVRKLARTLVLQVNTEDRRRARLLPDAERTARQHCLLAQEHHQRATEDDTRIARQHLEAAIEKDPNYAPAYAWLCLTVQRTFTQKWGDMDEATARSTALDLARRAVQLEPASPLCLARLAFVLMLHKRYEEAITTARAALQSHRRLTWESTTTAAEVLGCCGLHRETVDVLRAALADDTNCAPTTHAVLGRSLLFLGEQEAALVALQLCRTRVPAYLPCLLSIVVAAAESGQMEIAGGALTDLVAYHPWWTPDISRGHWLVRHQEEDERFRRAFSETESYLAAVSGECLHR